MKKLIQGNEAIAIGALDAGMKFYAGYPITPASEIMHFLAKQKDIKFLQAEDELASINMCLGASLGGAKSMTATSGPGFSLMQEGIGFGHMARIPSVIVNVQRVGPSTGMPTLPSQGDLIQTIHGSHGDYHPIVFYPNSVQELYDHTIHAFNAAEQSKTPVVLLSDGMISQMYESIELNNKIKSIQRKEKPFGEQTRHVTGLLTKDGLPATRNYEHYAKWLKDYKNEITKVSKDYEFYEYLENKKSENLIICFGAVSKPLYEMKNEYSIFRPIRMFPILEKQIKQACEKHKKIFVVEMNDGQYASEIKKIVSQEKVISIPVFGGQINLEEIKEKLK
jgi:2-oxoglutarate/2-oxoacid ferredoxin oxidoreductase subunit alpha